MRISLLVWVKTSLTWSNVLDFILNYFRYVENERARLTKVLAQIKEAEGDIAKAAEILQEVQVETYGTMEKSEKVEYILDQVTISHPSL